MDIYYVMYNGHDARLWTWRLEFDPRRYHVCFFVFSFFFNVFLYHVRIPLTTDNYSNST